MTAGPMQSASCRTALYLIDTAAALTLAGSIVLSGDATLPVPSAATMISTGRHQLRGSTG
jgi:hypothetical protein